MRRHRAAALALAVGVALAGCASGGDGDTASSTTTAAPTTTTIPSAAASRTTVGGVEVAVADEAVVTPATGCTTLQESWAAANPGQPVPDDLCEVSVDVRRWTATAGARSVTAEAPLTAGAPAAPLVLVEEVRDGELTLVVVRTTPEVASVSIASGAAAAADVVAPADGVAALAVVGGYDRVEARSAAGAVLTTCFAEPVDEAGGQCLSATPGTGPSTTHPPTTG